MIDALFSPWLHVTRVDQLRACLPCRICIGDFILLHSGVFLYTINVLYGY